MSLEDTIRRIADRFVKNDLPGNEEEGKNQVIIPILGELGWDVYNQRGTSEVEYERPVKHSGAKNPDFVDIALHSTKKRNRECVYLVEAKAPKKSLKDHVAQLFKYAVNEGVDLCVLTNAEEWWLYLPLEKGEDRRFAEINFGKDDPDQIVNKLEQFLRRENVLDETAEEAAKERLKALRDVEYLNAELPSTWNKMISDPDQGLVKLIAQRVSARIHLSPDPKQIKDFLQGKPLQDFPTKSPNKSNGPQKKPEQKPASKPQPQTGGQDSKKKSSKPSYIVLFGERHSVKTYKDILFKVVEILHNMYEPRLLEILSENWDDVSWLISHKMENRRFEKRDSIPYHVSSHGNFITMLWRSRKLLEETGSKGGDLKVFDEHGQEIDTKGSLVLPISGNDLSHHR